MGSMDMENLGESYRRDEMILENTQESIVINNVSIFTITECIDVLNENFRIGSFLKDSLLKFTEIAGISVSILNDNSLNELDDDKYTDYQKNKVELEQLVKDCEKILNDSKYTNYFDSDEKKVP